MRNRSGKFILICIFLLTFSCSHEKAVLEISDNYFSHIDQRDYKAAYELLSQSDKQIMDADSFYVFCFNQEGLHGSHEFKVYSQISEDFKKESTVIESIKNGKFEESLDSNGAPEQNYHARRARIVKEQRN